MTLPRSGRADRRREGLLPVGDDPMLRRPPPRPSGPPPGAGRRRTDVDPTAAPGRPPLTGERRVTPTPPPVPPATAASFPAATPASVPGWAGPMTSAVPVAGATARPVPPAPPRRGDDRPGDPPATTGMPGWAADPGPATPAPQDLTQRVSGAAPAGSAWGTTDSAAPVAMPSAVPSAVPGRPLRSVAPALARAPQPAIPPREVPQPEVPQTATAQPAPAAGSGAERERVRRPVDVPVGGRAAARLERQAAEAARKKSGRRGPAAEEPESHAQRSPGRDDDAPPARRAPRRLVQGLVAMALIAVGVLGFWSFTGPGTQETSAATPTAISAPPPVGTAPEQQSVAPEVAVPPAPLGPVRAPITVLNSTNINGLAADVGDQFSTGGWQVLDTGASPVDDVATTTVYFTAGDTEQQQAAAQLVEQFPDVSGPAQRYFDVPGVDAPGLVVVVTGNWRP